MHYLKVPCGVYITQGAARLLLVDEIHMLSAFGARGAI